MRQWLTGSRLTLFLALSACAPSPVQTGYMSTVGSGDPSTQTCMPTVQQKLNQLGIKDVQRVAINQRLAMFGGEGLIGYNAWVKLDRCSGDLVIEMTTDCYVQQTYTRNGCTIAGIQSY